MLKFRIVERMKIAYICPLLFLRDPSPLGFAQVHFSGGASFYTKVPMYTITAGNPFSISNSVQYVLYVIQYSMCISNTHDSVH